MQLLLSVSSNGSTWVKLRLSGSLFRRIHDPFSILERIDVGETTDLLATALKDVEFFQYPRTDRRG